jgi:hypothetical protein
LLCAPPTALVDSYDTSGESMPVGTRPWHWVFRLTFVVGVKPLATEWTQSGLWGLMLQSTRRMSSLDREAPDCKSKTRDALARPGQARIKGGNNHRWRTPSKSASFDASSTISAIITTIQAAAKRAGFSEYYTWCGAKGINTIR